MAMNGKLACLLDVRETVDVLSVNAAQKETIEISHTDFT